MTAGISIILIAAGLAAMLFVPDGIILAEMKNAYYTDTPFRIPAAVRPYGITLAAGAAIAVGLFLLVSLLRGRREGKTIRGYLLFTAGAVCFGFLFSRLLYCLTSIIFYVSTAGAGAIFRWWEGGLSMIGAILGVLLSATLTIRKDEKACETIVPSFALMIAAARFAEHYENIRIGRGMDVEFENIFSVPDEFGSVLNVWLIELAVVLVICAGLLAWRAADKRCPHGFAFLAAFLVFWGVVQVLMESLRADHHMIWGFVKSQQLFSFLLAFLILMSFAWKRKRRTAVALMAAGMVAAVFGLEKALDRLPIPDYWIYLVFLILVINVLHDAVCVMRRDKAR